MIFNGWWKLLCGLSLVVIAGCDPALEAKQERPQVPAGEAWLAPSRAREAGIATEAAQSRDVDRQLLTSGRITFDDQRVARVFSPITGRVTRVVAQLGQRVKKGDALAQIESPDLGNAFSDLVKAKADLAATEREYRRQRELYDAHAGPQRDLDAAEAAFRKAQAELQRSEEKARLLQADAGDRVTQQFTLRAPIDGEVIGRNVNPGAEVLGQYSGGTAAELYTVGELDQVWVLADVYEVDLQRIQVGAPVDVKVVAFPDRVFRGRVDWIADAVDPASRTVKVRCVIDNADRALKPEMYATVALTVPGRAALVIPRDALLRVGDQTIVFVQTGVTKDGDLKFERRVVVVDEEGVDGVVAVLHGLSTGEKVVSSGSILLLGMV